jgi:hypothetical protein
MLETCNHCSSQYHDMYATMLTSRIGRENIPPMLVVKCSPECDLFLDPQRPARTIWGKFHMLERRK